MKSKKDMQKVVVALAMALKKGGQDALTEYEEKHAMVAMDILLWAMDYPNNFNKFADPVTAMCPIDDSTIDRVFEEAAETIEEIKQRAE